jgi:hypothetical protein
VTQFGLTGMPLGNVTNSGRLKLFGLGSRIGQKDPLAIGMFVEIYLSDNDHRAPIVVRADFDEHTRYTIEALGPSTTSIGKLLRAIQVLK